MLNLEMPSKIVSDYCRFLLEIALIVSSRLPIKTDERRSEVKIGDIIISVIENQSKLYARTPVHIYLFGSEIIPIIKANVKTDGAFFSFFESFTKHGACI